MFCLMMHLTHFYLRFNGVGYMVSTNQTVKEATHCRHYCFQRGGGGGGGRNITRPYPLRFRHAHSETNDRRFGEGCRLEDVMVDRVNLDYFFLINQKKKLKKSGIEY